MITEFRLPDLGEGLPEAEIVAWHVAAGDEVALNQTIAEVETAKAVVELPSPFAGTVAELRHAEGDVVAVGEVLIAFDVAGAEEKTDAGAHPDASAAVGGASESQAASEPTEAAGAATPNLVGYGAAPRGAGRPQRRPRAVGATGSSAAAAEAATLQAVLEAAPHDALTGGGGGGGGSGTGLRSGVHGGSTDDVRRDRPRSTPPVRKLAKDLGIDLALVEAELAGDADRAPDALITRADVEAYAERAHRREAAAAGRTAASDGSRDTARAAATGSGERETRLPIRGVRKATAAAMVRSAFTAPHVTCFLDVDVTETTRLLADLRADRRLAGHRIGILAVVAKAVCLALRRHPELNSHWDDDAAQIVQYHYVNLGIAAATERGLIVPNIPDADRMGLAELADALGALAETARSGRTPLEALSGGTFSITNFGVFGVDSGTPILNPGEAGILGVGAVRRRPWEHDGEIALRDVLTLSLSFDHRLADGEQGSLFLVDVAEVLRDPGRAMLLA